MSNPAYSRIKIGKSAQDPTKYRAKELYQTGVPEPMKVEYSALVEDEDLLERLVHQRFHKSRPNKGREFFEIDVPTAIKGIRKLAAERSPILHEKVDDWEEEPLDQEPEVTKKLAQEHQSIQNIVNVADQEIQGTQAKIDQVLEKHKYTKKFINSCYLLLAIGAAFSSFYGALNIVLYLIAAFACLFVIKVGSGIFTDGKVEKLNKQIKTKQERPASPFTWAIWIGVLFICFLIYITGASID